MPTEHGHTSVGGGGGVGDDEFGWFFFAPASGSSTGSAPVARRKGATAPLFSGLPLLLQALTSCNGGQFGALWGTLGHFGAGKGGSFSGL